MTDNNKQTQQERPVLILAGKPATERELKRILNAPAPASDPNDRATKPIGTMSRPFKILR